MYHGDTLHAETRVLSKRLSNSRPGEGVVTLEHTGRNQDGVVTAIAVRAVMVHCRPNEQS
jgi:acyl dehydratase